LEKEAKGCNEVKATDTDPKEIVQEDRYGYPN